jgi:hypothetical protein
MEYKFKVNDKVKMTQETFDKMICASIAADDVLEVTGLTSWPAGGKVVQAYYLQFQGDGKGIFLESEIEPASGSKVIQKKISKKEPKVIEITKWALVNKFAPFVIDPELFDTRAEARLVKKTFVLGDSLKVVKVKIQYEV